MAAIKTTLQAAHTSGNTVDRRLAAVATGLIILRVANALSIKTFFQPDEYFQSLEPAWQSAFGEESGAWITWEWREHLRSSLHPLLFASIYKVAASFSDLILAGPDLRAEILIAAPKILQAFFAAATDLFTYLLACQVYNQKKSMTHAALALTVFSPWQFFAAVRTLSNSLETALTIFALYLWPWQWFLEADRPPQSTYPATQRSERFYQKHKDDQSLTSQEQNDSAKNSANARLKALHSSSDRSAALKKLYAALAAAALACVLRPTNVMVWVTVSITLLVRQRSISKTLSLAQAVLTSGSAVLAISTAADRAYYNSWVFPPLRFLYFNVVQSLAVFYGKNRYDYYLTEGLPLLLTTGLPFAAVGMWQALKPGPDRPGLKICDGRQVRFVLALAVATSVVALSVISHKEVRFIYPLLPILHILAAKPMAAFFHPFPSSATKWRLGLLLFGLAINVFIASYTAFVHQRGVIDVLEYLRHEHERRMPYPAVGEWIPRADTTVGFFMPCHSTPWRSHLVYPEINAWALTCEPPLHLDMSERGSYLDEADVFYSHPLSWIDDNMKDRRVVMKDVPPESEFREGDDQRRAWPQYLAFFQQLEPVLNVVLEGSRYEECWRGFNTHWHDDRRRQGDVVVWCLRA